MSLGSTLAAPASDVARIGLPDADGRITEHRLRAPGDWRRPTTPFRSRVAFAAAHVVPRPTADTAPGSTPDLDWDVTLRFRRHLWSWGLGVAEAMDTAQRGMGLDWPTARELIRRSAAEARAFTDEQRAAGTGLVARITAGAGTDQLDPGTLPAGHAGLNRVRDAYLEQLDAVAEAGADPIIMASRALAAAATGPADYRAIYDELLERAQRPVILHWLGEMFDPALAGYWGYRDVAAATDAFVELITDHPGKVDGVKVSLLDADHERGLRSRLPEGVRLYTGDDFNYPELICGNGDDDHPRGHSDALLGIFAAIAPAASSALQDLDSDDHDDHERARATLESTRELGRHVFAAPTYHYKTGIAFLAWLNGHQPGFAMINGLAAGRSALHLVQVFRLADAAGLLDDPDLACARMRTLLDLHGFPR